MVTNKPAKEFFAETVSIQPPRTVCHDSSFLDAGGVGVVAGGWMHTQEVNSMLRDDKLDGFLDVFWDEKSADSVDTDFWEPGKGRLKHLEYSDVMAVPKNKGKLPPRPHSNIPDRSHDTCDHMGRNVFTLMTGSISWSAWS